MQYAQAILLLCLLAALPLTNAQGQDAERVKTAIEFIKAACVTEGTKLEIAGDAQGEITLTRILKSGAAANVKFSSSEVKGLPTSLNKETGQQASEMRLCMTPYIDRILGAILGPAQASPKKIELNDPFERFKNHKYAKKQIPNGYMCSESSDCKPSPDRGHCYPGPPNNEFSYCEDGASNCAYPGTPGTTYGTKVLIGGLKYECFQPPTGSARWRLAQ